MKFGPPAHTRLSAASQGRSEHIRYQAAPELLITSTLEAAECSQRERRPMLWLNVGMLAVEAQQVVALRLLRLASGGEVARHESWLMIGEKVVQASVTAAQVFDGASLDSIISAYREVVQANAARLGSEVG